MSEKNVIMVVDDNRDLVEILKNILSAKGYEVHWAYSGKDLFALLNDHRPDLILLDIMMPEMDGLTVLAHLRGSPATSKIPVILLSAKNRIEDVLNGYGKGGDYYLSKPFTPTQLINGIEVVLGTEHNPQQSKTPAP
ncbi:MAG: response regulator [Deltaproteobacteria bacterium]|nr:response regulator [Deltaproteobacteria bacterium]